MIEKNTPQEVIIQTASKCDVNEDCKSCKECCKANSGYVLDEDIPKMAKSMGKTEEEFKKEYLDEIELFGRVIHKLKLKRYPVGECVFLEEEGCSIHQFKPTHCKTGTWDSKNSQECHDWFILNKLVNKDCPESIRQWKQHLEYTERQPITGGALNELVPDEEELHKILKREI